MPRDRDRAWTVCDVLAIEAGAGVSAALTEQP